MTEKTQDEKIGKMFDTGYNADPKPAIVDNFDDSVKFYHDFIISKDVDSVLDVGMGAGGLLLALQNSGIKQVFGNELAKEGVNLAKKRFEMYGDPDQAEFFGGSFLDHSIEQVDVITLHRVIHCHPNYIGLIQKAIEIAPKYILYTLPRNTLMTKIFIGAISIMSKPITGFRAYVHSTEGIKDILQEGTYSEIHHSSTRFWETSIFERETNTTLKNTLDS